MSNRSWLAALILLLALFSSSCAELLIATGATGAAVGVIKDEPFESQLSDKVIWGTMNAKFVANGLGAVSVQVYDGSVVLTGRVPSAYLRGRAEAIAWGVAGVRRVVNDIIVGAPERDVIASSAITGRAIAGLGLAKGVRSMNYSVETVEGVVYIMGVARTREEFDKVIAIVRSVPGVKKVVSYIRLMGDNSEDHARSEDSFDNRSGRHGGRVGIRGHH